MEYHTDSRNTAQYGLRLLRRMDKKSKIHETPALYHCPPAQPAVPADPRGRLAHFSTYFRAGG